MIIYVSVAVIIIITASISINIFRILRGKLHVHIADSCDVYSVEYIVTENSAFLHGILQGPESRVTYLPISIFICIT